MPPSAQDGSTLLSSFTSHWFWLPAPAALTFQYPQLALLPPIMQFSLHGMLLILLSSPWASSFQLVFQISGPLPLPWEALANPEAGQTTLSPPGALAPPFPHSASFYGPIPALLTEKLLPWGHWLCLCCSVLRPQCLSSPWWPKNMCWMKGWRESWQSHIPTQWWAGPLPLALVRYGQKRLSQRKKLKNKTLGVCLSHETMAIWVSNPSASLNMHYSNPQFRCWGGEVALNNNIQ